MDYRESTLTVGCTEKVTCIHCGGHQHQVQSVITYGFYFLEYLPLFPVSRKTLVNCLQCQASSNINDQVQQKKQIFSDWLITLFLNLRLLSTFTGSFLILLMLSHYFSDIQQQKRQSIAHIQQPKINDFYYLNYKKMSGDVRPHEKYRIAKVVDITGGMVSLVYGNYFYPMKRSLADGIRFGHTRDFDYFEKKRRNFSYAELDRLFQQGVIYHVERPEGNLIDGNPVINKPNKPSRWHYLPGKREYEQAMGFIKATYIADRFEQAFRLLKKSAEMGYAPGQTNLAELYLNGIEGNRDVDNAVHWLIQAALQGYQPAIEKFRVVCAGEEQCSIDDFYQILNDAGTAYRID